MINIKLICTYRDQRGILDFSLINKNRTYIFVKCLIKESHVFGNFIRRIGNSLNSLKGTVGVSTSIAT